MYMLLGVGTVICVVDHLVINCKWVCIVSSLRDNGGNALLD